MQTFEKTQGEKIFLSNLIDRGNLESTPKKETQKEAVQKAEEIVSAITPEIIDLIIQQSLS